MIIPYFYEYSKHEKKIKNFLITDYNLILKKYDNISYKFFPTPNLVVKNALLNTKGKTKIKSQEIIIFLNFFNIYNLNNLSSSKINLRNSHVSHDINDLKSFFKFFQNSKNKLRLIESKILFFDNGEKLVTLKDVSYSNYGYKKNIFNGNLFDKEFKLELKNDFQEIFFKIPNAGINLSLKLDQKASEENKTITGRVKAKILNSNLRFNFEQDNKKIEISETFYRSKKLSFNSKSILNLNPFTYIQSNINIKDINPQIFKKIQIKKFFELKDFRKKINGSIFINYKSKKFSKNFISNFNSELTFAYGRVNYKKSISFLNLNTDCNGSLNTTLDFPKLEFECNFKKKQNNFDISVKGNLNILKNNIKIKKINFADKKIVSKEDIEFYEKTFENIFLKNSFFETFNKDNVKEFIILVS